MPRAFTYIRLPDKNAIAAVLSEHDLQVGLHNIYCDKFGMEYRTCETFSDNYTFAVTPFAQRPGGNQVMVQAQRGDLVIFYEFALAFASLQDMLTTWQTWDARGVSSYYHDLDLTVSATDQGALVFLNQLMQFHDTMTNWKTPKRLSNEQIYALINPMKERGLTYAMIAEELNARNFRMLKGSKWNKTNLRIWYNRIHHIMTERKISNFEAAVQETMPSPTPIDMAAAM